MAEKGKKALILEICALEGAPVQLEAAQVSIPGVVGPFTVLPNHAPLLSTLDIGVLAARTTAGEERLFFVNGGLARVLDNHVWILTDTVERGEDVDEERAHRAVHRAEERLQSHQSSINILRAEMAMKRALARLRARKTPK